MTRRSNTWMAALGLVAVLLAARQGAAQDLPTVKGKKVVATVEGESIALDEFNREAEAVRSAGGAADASAQRALLDRMIRMKLIVQEARRMELHKVSEIRKMLDAYAHVALREELVDRLVKGVQADRGDVEKAYRASVGEWKVSAALFSKEEDAKAMLAGLEKGQDFDALTTEYQAQGKITKTEREVWLSRESADPAVRKALAGMAVGATSGVVSTKSGAAILKLEAVRYREDAAERARIEQALVIDKRKDTVGELDHELKKKWVTIHRDVLNSIDYDAESPGIDAFLKDRRVVADIKGEKPVTVAELTEDLKFQFFHGTKMAGERKRLNAKKEQVLDGLLHRKVFRKEALRLKLDKTDAYKRRLKENEESTLFGIWLRKVIAPGIKLKEEDVKAYYDEHRNDFTAPEMIRLRSLVFSTRQSAEAAVESLRKGADFQWVANQADDQVNPNAKGVLTFDGRPIITAELPDGIRRAVAAASSGEVRFYESPEKHYYALVVAKRLAPEPRPLDEVRADVAEKVLGLKIQKAVEEYADRLRTLSRVKVYLSAP